MKKKIEVDFRDIANMRKLMDERGKNDEIFSGKSKDNEPMTFAISSDTICITTYQNNGAIRYNILHYDGTTEEIFTH